MLRRAGLSMAGGTRFISTSGNVVTYIRLTDSGLTIRWKTRPEPTDEDEVLKWAKTTGLIPETMELQPGPTYMIRWDWLPKTDA